MASERLIATDRSVIVAADVNNLATLRALARATCDVPGISGYKVGLDLGLRFGLSRVVHTLVNAVGNANTLIIYDHQKAGNDIPEMGANFASVCKDAGIDAAILFPFAGPVTAERWIKSLQDAEVGVLVGWHMTHPQFLESEGGWLPDNHVLEVFELALENGVRNFVVPGNKVQHVAKYRRFFDQILGEEQADLFAPGFVAQGGVITETGQAAGSRFHAIVGSTIYKAENMRAAAKEMTSQIAT